MQSTLRSDTTPRHINKYVNANPLHRFVLNRFFDQVAAELRALSPRSVLDIGCGEGLFLGEVERRGVRFADYLGIDVRQDAVAMAQALHPARRFVHADGLTWSGAAGPFDLVIASEVLEHIDQPGPFLARLTRSTARHLLLTVPREPFFRTLNLLRGRDIWRLGNHPEHINQWTFAQFKRFVSRHAKVLRATTVSPFTIIIATPASHPRQEDRSETS